MIGRSNLWQDTKSTWANKTMPAFDRFRKPFTNFPAPGRGGGYNIALLSVANYCTSVGLDPQKIFSDIRRHMSMIGD